MNKINKSETGTAAKEEGQKKAAAISLLKTLEDMLRNRIKKKQEKVHKTKNIAENDRICIEIDTLHWVIAQNLQRLDHRLRSPEKRRESEKGRKK